LIIFFGVNAMNETAAMSQEDQKFKAEFNAFFSLLNPRTKQIVRIRIERHIKERNEIDKNIDVLASALAVNLLLRSIESQGIIDTKTAGNDPIAITGFTDHAIDRMMNDESGRKGVCLSAIIDALKNPCKIDKSDATNSGCVFCGKKAKVVVSTRKDTLGSIITVYPVHTKKNKYNNIPLNTLSGGLFPPVPTLVYYKMHAYSQA
jgi:hypothetical protein